jgi:membrane protease YdiL (CAAX protease family)
MVVQAFTKRVREEVAVLWKRDRRFVLFGLGSRETSWRGLDLFALIFFASLFLAGAVLPFIYWAVQWAATDFDSQLARSLLRNRVDKVFDFLRWVPVLAGLPWLMWRCHLWSLRALGLAPTRYVRSTVGWGFAVGVVLVAVLAAGQMTFGTVAVSPRAVLSLPQLAEWVALSLGSAVIVGATEEIIFRGLILRLFYTATLYPWFALTLSAVFFAYTHFKIPPGEWTKIGSIHWDTGWQAAYWMLIGISVEFELKRFIALWLLGMVLGTLMLRTSSLWPGISLHGGLVFAMLLYHDFVSDFAQIGSFWGSKALIDGWAVVCALAFLFLVVLVTPPFSRFSFLPPP